MTPEQEALAARIADSAAGATAGESLPEGVDDTDRVSSNLAGLGRIANAHRAALAMPESEAPCLFEWRHLRVERELGQGGFGTVYQAWDTVLRRRVALKLIRDGRVSESRDRQLIAEAQQMARVRHVNILAVHGADSADGRTGIWSDLLEGSTLQQVIDDQCHLSPKRAVEMALGLGDALTLIHRRGMVHGDIKPANIMIQTDGTPVLMDFGAAQGLEQQTSSAGSPLVMAPEQFTGGPATAATDIYGLGATLYFALLSRFPVEAESFESLDALHRGGATVSFESVARRWRRLLRRMLSADPDERPDASEVVEQLRAIATARPRMLIRLATAVVIGSLAAGVVAATLAYRSAEQSRERTERVKDLVVDAIRTTSPNDQSGPAVIEAAYTRLAELASERLQDYPAGLADMSLVAAEGLWQLGRTEQAFGIARQGHDLMLQLENASPKDLSYSWSVLSGLLMDREDFDGAEEAVRRSLQELDKLPETEAAARKLVNYNRLATLAGRRGDMQGGLRAHQQVLAQREKVYGPESIRLAVDYHNVATAFSNVGDYEAAIENEGKAAAILEAAGDGQSVRMGFVLQGLGHVLGWANRHQEAVTTFGEARNLLAGSLPADHSRLKIMRVADWGSRYHLGEAEAAIDALRAMLLELPADDPARLPAYRQLGDLMIHEQNWPAVVAAYAVCVEDQQARQQPFIPYYRAALAYARYQVDRSAEDPTAPLADAVAHFERSGMVQHRLLQQLKAWQDSDA
ncbi:MAG: serine/threonine-protein kinase [Pseudomonadota bacterium]